MPLAAILVCLAVWLGCGILFWKNLSLFRKLNAGLSRGHRGAVGIGMLFLSAMLLWIGLDRISQAGPPNTLPVHFWMLIALLGAVFVVGQCIAVSVMLSLAEPDVTNTPRTPSNSENSEGK